MVDNMKQEIELQNVHKHLLNIHVVIQWVSIENELPPKHTYVWLSNIETKETGHEFVHELDLETERYQRRWTHWAVAVPPVQILNREMKTETTNGTKTVLDVSCYPTDDEIIKMVDDFTKDLNVSNATKRASQFGYQEGLYKMIEIWKQSNNDR